MKNAFNSILLLTLVGVAALACGAMYFGAPLFGWIIMAAIFVVFLAEQFMSMAAARKISAEEEQIAACESGRGFRVSGDGVVARRLEMARHLVEKGIRIDSPIAYEVLSNSTGLPMPRSSSGTVILLGLMGTFFGLMYSVATAGGAIDNSTTQGTLDTIQVLFQNMKGIFGTSLCGLFAALVLNASRSLLLGARERFLARLDSLTLELQGEDAAASATEMEKTELERLFQAVEKNLAKTVESLESAVSNSMSTISAKLDEKLGAVASATENAMNASSKNIASAVADQVKQSSEQWKSFMDKLTAEASAGVQSQKEGLETLKTVALQVAEKAQAGSAELSKSVSEKLSALSSDILGAFQKLSESSAVLLEAQKALTESIDNRVMKEKEATDALGGNLVETAELMRVNQSELSANLEMLRAGLETILEKLSGDTAEHEEEDNFVEHLNQSLEAFHERASEVLMENAVKTQEILLEVMEQVQRANHKAEQPKVEG
ncbi:MAG: hypothetical protein IJ909_11590 [Fibrobacter sp.]|nr:hypothetical protein [Fibrobacter sp.]